MNTSMLTHQHLLMTPDSETKSLDERGLLAQWNFSSEQVTSLLWLWQWYQAGGSDRAVIVRTLEFLRLLVRSGELEV